MSALDLVVVLLGVVALGAAVALTVTTVALRTELRATRAARLDLEAAKAAFDEVAASDLEHLHDTVRRARDQVDRVEELVDVANAIGGRVDSATEVTYRALTSPVIKTVALASGTRRAAQRLRPGRHDDR